MEEHRGVNMEECGGVNIKGEDQDPMEDDNHAPENTFQNDGTNALIHDTFGTGVTATNDDDDYDEDDIESIHDIPLLEKENTTFMKVPDQLFSLLYYCW